MATGQTHEGKKSMKTKANYIALLRDIEKHKELIAEDRDLRCLGTIKDKVFTRELIEDCGWNLPAHVPGNENWFRISNNLTAGTFGGDTKRSITWEDEAKDPNNEFLLCVSFSTGPYFFGEDYDVKFFKAFFQELETYGPSFKDSRNKSLYFTKEKAGLFLQNYDEIVKKHRELYRSTANERKAKNLREELQKLEDNNRNSGVSR